LASALLETILLERGIVNPDLVSLLFSRVMHSCNSTTFDRNLVLVTVEEGARKSRREKEAANRSIRKELNVAEVWR